MAIKPAINPGVAVAERPATLSGAMNFISGGQTLGTSIVSSAANKIVGFQRGAAAVAPKAPDLGSIINTLSTNILSNVENKLQSVNQSIQQVIQNKFLSQLGEYRNRIQEITSNPPSKILQNFLSLYKEALGYIQFLGNRKNIKRLGDNLQALQNVFSETFKIAALVRTTIVKIVRQLSNLPTASSGPGGLNLDINVPGGPLKRAGRLPGVLKMAGIGVAAAGAGALGSKVVSGMMDVGGDVQPDTTGVMSSIPTPLLDRFMEILNRFDKALQGFQAPKQAPSVPSAPIASKTADKSGGGGGGGGAAGGAVDLSKISGDTPEQKAFLATVGSTEAGTYNTIVGGQQIPELTQMTIQEVYDMGMKSKLMTGKLPERFGGRSIRYGADSHAMGRYQFIPQTMMSAMKSAGLKPTDLYSPENQDRMALAFATSIGINVNRQMTESDYRKAGSSVAWEGMRKISYGEAKKRYDAYLNKARGNVKATGGPEEDAQKLEAQIRASTDKSQSMRGIAGDVSKPAVPTDQQSNVSIVPLVMGSPQSASTPSGTQVALPPVMSKGGATVPFLPSSNEDNFFTILSKVVYNIVDG